MNGLHGTWVNEKSLRSFFPLFTRLIKDGLFSLANLSSQLAVACVSWGWGHLTNTGSHHWGTLSCWYPRGPYTKGHSGEERRERPETERENKAFRRSFFNPLKKRVCVCMCVEGEGLGTGSCVVGQWTDLGHWLFKVSWGWFCKESPYSVCVCLCVWLHGNLRGFLVRHAWVVG